MDALRRPYVATAAQWHAAGISSAQLRSFVRLGYLVQVRRGVYATRQAAALAKSDERRAHALQVAAVRASIGHDLVGSHHSAALIHGFELLKRPSAGTVTMTRRPPKRSRSRKAAGVLIHNAELPSGHVTRQYGTEVTTAARAVIDLARTLPFIEAVVAADSALPRRKTTKEELRSVCDACGRWPRMVQAKRVVAASNGLAESVLESCARVMFDAIGLEAPEIQVTVRGPGFAYRVDFCWKSTRRSLKPTAWRSTRPRRTCSRSFGATGSCAMSATKWSTSPGANSSSPPNWSSPASARPWPPHLPIDLLRLPRPLCTLFGTYRAERPATGGKREAPEFAGARAPPRRAQSPCTPMFQALRTGS
jgi:Transcriptional regulator, AbiEi antitoxin